MKISTKGRYGLRVMVDLAKYNTGEYISLKDISSRQDISLKYLEHIVRILQNDGLVRSARGVKGGYKIARSPSLITVRQVLEACEGDLCFVDCEETGTMCARSEYCETKTFWQDLNNYLLSYLESMTIQDLLDKNDNYDYVI